MNEHSRPGLGLFELLGRTWQRPAAITDIRFSPDLSTVAFAAADGSVALGPVAEAETPESRIRISGDLGQMRILPRSKPPMPLIGTAGQSGGAVPLAPYVAASFIIGTEAGEVKRLSAQGEAGDTLFNVGGRVISLDHRGTLAGLTVATDGEHLYVARGREAVAKSRFEDGDAIDALAISPDSTHIAGLCGQELAIWTLEGASFALRVTALPAPPISLCWNESGSHVACGLATGGFSLIGAARGSTHTVMNFPKPVGSLSWSVPVNALIASGAYRIAAWLLQDGMAGEAIATGRPGLVAVDVVAAHPRRDLVAAAYANGQIVVAQLRSEDELVVRVAGAPVTALAWTGDGRHLAVGDSEGSAALLTFPPQLFK
ncbi:hypothetical protein LMIY3S_02937 [Labrys miyagiensis]